MADIIMEMAHYGEHDEVNARLDIDPPRSLILIGPGKHFGAEIINKFYDEGFCIGVISNRRESVETLLDAVGNRRIEVALADINDRKGFSCALKNMAKRLRGVDCVIYNPKSSVSGVALSIDPEDLAESIQVNVTGALVMIQALLPYLSHGVARPAIIITGGGYKDNPDSSKLALSIGKAGLHSLTQCLVQPLKAKGIDLITIVIDGSVRRGAVAGMSSGELATFYWSVFSSRSGSIFRYSSSTKTGATNQLKLL